MDDPDLNPNIYTCDTELICAFRGLKNNRPNQGILRVTRGELRGMDVEFSMNQLRIFGFSLSGCDLISLIQWKPKFTAEIYSKKEKNLVLKGAWIGPRVFTKVKSTILKKDPGFLSWLSSKGKTHQEFFQLFPKTGNFGKFFPDFLPFTFQECQGIYHKFHGGKKSLLLSAQIVSGDLIGKFIVFDFSDLYIHGHRLKRNVKFIPLIDCSELITFELRKLSTLEATQRDFNTEELSYLKESLQLGVHIAYIGQRPVIPKQPRDDDDPELKNWLAKKNFEVEAFFKMITDPEDPLQKEKANDQSLKRPNEDSISDETKKPPSKAIEPKRVLEVGGPIQWLHSIKNPGFEENGKGVSVAKDTANAILERLMSCVSSNDPTLSTVISSTADFHMARFLSKTLVSSMMDFNLRMEKKLKNKLDQPESSTSSRSENLKETDSGRDSHKRFKRDDLEKSKITSRSQAYKKNALHAHKEHFRNTSDVKSRIGPENAARNHDLPNYGDSTLVLNRATPTNNSYVGIGNQSAPFQLTPSTNPPNVPYLSGQQHFSNQDDRADHLPTYIGRIY